MNVKSGHIKDTTSDDNSFRQFIINCLGSNDQQKYFSLTPFGIDFVAPENTRSLTIKSANKDVQYNLGVLNKIRIEDLTFGESVIFSTDETGETLKSSITLRNTGDIEVNKDIVGNATINIKSDGTIELNGTGDFIAGFNDLKAGFDELKDDYNNHIHQIPIGQVIVQVTGGSGAPAVGVANTTPIDLSDTDTPSSASIDTSKKVNLKTE